MTGSSSAHNRPDFEIWWTPICWHAFRVVTVWLPVTIAMGMAFVRSSLRSISQNDNPLPVGISTSRQITSGGLFSIDFRAVSKLCACCTSKPICWQRDLRAVRKSESSSISKMVFDFMFHQSRSYVERGCLGSLSSVQVVDGGLADRLRSSCEDLKDEEIATGCSNSGCSLSFVGPEIIIRSHVSGEYWAGVGSSSSGRLTITVVPIDMLLSVSIHPPCCLTISYTVN